MSISEGTSVSPTKPSHSRLKKFLPIAGVALVLIISAIVIYAFAVGPSKEPYKKALSQYKNVYNANVAFTQIGASMNAGSASDEQFANNIAATENALEALQTEADVLGKEPVLSDGEGRDLYNSFHKQLDAYATYNTNVIASIEKIRPVIYKCSQNASSVTESVASAEAIRECATSLEGIQDVPNADYKQMVLTYKTNYASLATNIAAAAALKAKEGSDASQDESVNTERTQILDNLNAANTTLSRNLQTHRAEVDITNSAKALDDWLSEKARIFFWG